MGLVNGGEILVRCLEAEGVESIFGISDISYSLVFESAKKHDMEIIGGRHESANVHMADGWARTTGDTAVAIAGMGPGVANMVPGVINAKSKVSPSWSSPHNEPPALTIPSGGESSSTLLNSKRTNP